MKLDYMLLDVFTTERLKGNPLAVVCRADGLLDDEMQAIAREFNLSETVFLQRPAHEHNSASLRIFTPSRELPFAGHPTVGAAVVLGLQNKVSAVRVEERVGLITALVERVDKRTGLARFALPHLPREEGRAPARGDIAHALGLDPDDIGNGAMAPAVWSAGVSRYLVPVKSAELLGQIAPDSSAWKAVFPIPHHAVYVFAPTPHEPDNDLAARMFSMGGDLLSEDSGTGSAAAALIGLLARHAPQSGQFDLRLRQGREMGRPSTIMVQFRREAGVLVHGGIGGHAVIVGQGCLELGD